MSEILWVKYSINFLWHSPIFFYIEPFIVLLLLNRNFNIMGINLLPVVYAVDNFLLVFVIWLFLVLVLFCFYNTDFLKFGERVFLL